MFLNGRHNAIACVPHILLHQQYIRPLFLDSGHILTHETTRAAIFSQVKVWYFVFIQTRVSFSQDTRRTT